MIAYIDLTTDKILAISLRGEADNITSFECPDYVDIAKYNYVSSEQGVYDPNGFVLKEQNSDADEKLTVLITAGFTEEQAQVILQITNS